MQCKIQIQLHFMHVQLYWFTSLFWVDDCKEGRSSVLGSVDPKIPFDWVSSLYDKGWLLGHILCWSGAITWLLLTGVNCSKAIETSLDSEQKDN